MIKNRLLFVKSEEHDFDLMMENLKKDFLVCSCKCSYPDIRFHADVFKADLIICASKSLEQENIVDLVLSMPNTFIFCSTGEYTDSFCVPLQGLKYYVYDGERNGDGERFIRMICRDLPFRYAEFKAQICKLIYDCNMDFKPGAFRTGFTYVVEGIKYILFTEFNRPNVTANVYEYIAQKHNTTVTAVDNAMRRYVRYVWLNREELKQQPFFPRCAKGDAKPIVSDFIFEMSEMIFHEYRQDFYRYFLEINK